MFIGKFFEQPYHQSFEFEKQILLGDEGHLHINLVELSRASVGPAVFIAKTGRNLEVFVEPGYHQKLFELLWRLGQRIKLARIEAAGHEVVPCTFRRGTGQDGRVVFHESLMAEMLAHKCCCSGTQ
ncbi:MAG: hypothetical protein BWY09_01961 [Candidatus Hydrogenedentes bacterium ADurb.Bin179]|nr:MAG: hypothetical protein BWY09_01961 [Candidatus Hydrogenedentes bacterium ADurb.Bin179]